MGALDAASRVDGVGTERPPAVPEHPLSRDAEVATPAPSASSTQSTLLRGRPRSTSVSSGSPAPLPGARALFPDLTTTNTPPSADWRPTPLPALREIGSTVGRSRELDGPGKGWGHRATLSVPVILSPQPLSTAKVGRHRRTASVSPPGFSVMAEGSSAPEPAPTSNRSRPIPIAIALPLSKSHGSSPLQSSPSSGRLNSPHSLSPNSTHFSHHYNNNHATSHAALLSGVRSHALPHSPTHVPDDAIRDQYGDSIHNWAYPPRSSASGSSVPASPPFGATYSNGHQPSPLALEVHQNSPDLDLTETVWPGISTSDGGTDLPRVEAFQPDERMPGAFDTAQSLSLSPPLPAVLLDVPRTRRRAGSFTNAEEGEDSPSALYLAASEEPLSPFGQCDIRDRPAPLSTSPSSPPLFPSPAPVPVIVTRPRGKSFTSDRNFAPTLLPVPLLPSPLSLSTSPPAEPLATAPSAPEDDLQPPPSPHRSGLALPPPLVAPAPLPPHLGGPPLATSRVHTGRTARLNASNALLAKTGGVGEFLPKKHSPLASPRVPDERETYELYSEAGQDVGLYPAEDEGMVAETEVRPSVEEELEEAERTDMDLGLSSVPPSSPLPCLPPLFPPSSPTTGKPRLPTKTNGFDLSPSVPSLESPPGSPGAGQLVEYLALHSELTLALSPRRDGSTLPGPFAVTRKADQPEPKSGWDPDEDELEGYLAADSEGETYEPMESDFYAETVSPLERFRDSSEGLAGLERQREEVIGLDAYEALRSSELEAPPHLIRTLDALPLTSSFPSVTPASFDAFGMEVDAPTSALGLDASLQLNYSQSRSLDLLVGSPAGSTEMVREDSILISNEEIDVGAAGMELEADLDGGDAADSETETLSALERIFIGAKSDSPEERARAAHNLPEWLLAVDICEAVEYVLPLLPGLATDAEDIVKEVLAPQLDGVMWHFFSQCPLQEIASPNLSDPSSSFSPSFSPPASASSITTPRSPTSAQSKRTSPMFPLPTLVLAAAPRISSTTFTSLLGALLTDQSSVVAKLTQASLVRFLCRLKGKPVLPLSGGGGFTSSFLALPSPGLSSTNGLSSEIKDEEREAATHEHFPYEMGEEEIKVLEDEFVNGIVLGLARLDEDDFARDPTSEVMTPGGSVLVTHEKTVISTPVSDALTTEDLGEQWLQSVTTTSPDEILTSFFATPSLPITISPSSPHGSSSNLPTTVSSPPTAFSPLSLPYAPRLTTSSDSPPQSQAEEESAIGKMVSMSLISAIAMSECLDPEVLMGCILPEVERMRGERMFYVRKEAVQALGSLARTLPSYAFEEAILPLHAAFAHDPMWHVRRAACLALPSICKRLSPALLRSTVLSNLAFFSQDVARNVRSGALEILGEMIWLFEGDEQGVPPEVVRLFLGQKMDGSDEGPDAKALPVEHFQPMMNALDEPFSSACGADGLNSYFDGPAWGVTIVSPPQAAATLLDPDRPVMCAFNMPAVVLTLGPDNWHQLRPFYCDLSRDTTDKVRQSLASSLHEVSSIIGPTQADEALAEVVEHFLLDQEFIAHAMLNNMGLLLLNFSVTTLPRLLQAVGGKWDGIRNWRMREKVVRDLGGVGRKCMGSSEAEEALWELIRRGLKDRVASVREATTEIVPSLYGSALASTNPTSIVTAHSFLSQLSLSTIYRDRASYTSIVLSLVSPLLPAPPPLPPTGQRSDDLPELDLEIDEPEVQPVLGKDGFEQSFLPVLESLAGDGVVGVRIGVARVIAAVCLDGHYAVPGSRGPILGLLGTLASSPDRDVRLPILPYFTPALPSPPAPSTARPLFSRHPPSSPYTSRLVQEVRPVPPGSRMDMESEDSEDRMDLEDEEDIEMVERELESGLVTHELGEEGFVEISRN